MIEGKFLRGFGLLNPSNLHNLAGKYIEGYGTPFDLEGLAGQTGLDLNAVTHVRIVDVVGTNNPEYATVDHNGRIVIDTYSTPYNTGGFDLDAIGVINQNVTTGKEIAKAKDQLKFYPNPVTSSLTVEANDPIEEVRFFSFAGDLKLQLSGSGRNSQQIDGVTDQLSSGYYITKVTTSKGMVTGKFIVPIFYIPGFFIRKE